MTKAALAQEAVKLEKGCGVFKAKDPISALTHFIGVLAAVLLTPVLLIRAAGCSAGTSSMTAFSIFMLSQTLLYGASTCYHTFDISGKANLVMRKLDHMMIFVLIAGSYTPVCIVALKDEGTKLLIIVWTIALVGMLLMSLWLHCPKWVSSVLYIAMGWTCIGVIPKLLAVLPTGAFGWLLAGGILYTIGGIIYALKLSFMEKYIKGFGAHELFHCFVLGGTLCHFIMMYFYLVKL